jgi:glycine/D-amino acid oxidase-like deaminating enzyme
MYQPKRGRMVKNKHVAVIGGGIAGMEAASALSGQGIKVTLIEKQPVTGGKLNDWDHLFPDFSSPSTVVDQLKTKTSRAGVNVVYNTEISRIERVNGRFELSDERDVKIFADAVVMASGFNVCHHKGSVWLRTVQQRHHFGRFRTTDEKARETAHCPGNRTSTGSYHSLCGLTRRKSEKYLLLKSMLHHRHQTSHRNQQNAPQLRGILLLYGPEALWFNIRQSLPHSTNAT